MDKNIPGPGRYIPEKPFGVEAFKYSFPQESHKRTIISGEKDKKSNGPGKCASLNIKESGKYPISRLRNTTNSIEWSNYKLSRFSAQSKLIY